MKKLLIFSYFFPPLGLSGVQRITKFVKYLHDWDCTVITVGESLHKTTDKTLLSEIPPRTKIIRINDEHLKSQTDTFKEILLSKIQADENLLLDESIFKKINTVFESKLEDIRNLLMFPDFGVFWAMKVIQYLQKNFSFTDKFDAVLTTSSPYSAHLIGLFLKSQIKSIPWIADFRDEWTTNPYENNTDTSFHKKYAPIIEKKILTYADAVTTVTPLMNTSMSNHFDIPNQKFITIPNGFDEEDFKFDETTSIKKKKFKIIHAGHLYGPRSPDFFLQGLQKTNIPLENLEIEFLGKVSPEIKNAIQQKYSYFPIRWTPYTDHKSSLKKSQAADILLLLVGFNSTCKRIYTGKIFEYLRCKSPILAFSPENSLVSELLEDSNSGINISITEEEKLIKTLNSFYEDWLNGSLQNKFKRNSLKKYERQYQAKQLSKLMHEIIQSQAVCL